MENISEFPEPDHNADEQSIEESAAELFDGLSEDKKKEITRFIAIQKSFSGLLPPPDMLEHYNKVIQDGANRIMTIAEKQVDHRIAHEKRISKGVVGQGNRGQVFAFILGLCFIAGAVYLSAIGAQLSGIFMGFFGISGLVTVFLKTTLFSSDGGK